MERPPSRTLRIGDWFVNPLSGEIARGEERVRLEARTMRLLLCLAENPGEVVSIDTLLSQVWSGVVEAPATPSPARANSRMYAVLAIGIVLVVSAATYYLVAGRNATSQAAAEAMAGPKTIAVLPFLDLTDGMTEELIHKLSKVQGLRVPAPTAAFYFKGKQLPLAEIARSLRVNYVLDGSVRKSGDTLRVAARLVRAEDGYVVWSESCDRPVDDKLRVQDDIAGEVTSALRGSID